MERPLGHEEKEMQSSLDLQYPYDMAPDDSVSQRSPFSKPGNIFSPFNDRPAVLYSFKTRGIEVFHSMSAMMSRSQIICRSLTSQHITWLWA